MPTPTFRTGSSPCPPRRRTVSRHAAAPRLRQKQGVSGNAARVVKLLTLQREQYMTHHASAVADRILFKQRGIFCATSAALSAGGKG